MSRIKYLQTPNLPRTPIGELAEAELPEEFKQALLSAVHAIGAWNDDDAQGHYDDLYNALYPPVGLVSISATINTYGAVIYEGDPLNSIKPYLTVLANYDDGTSNEVTGYVLSGELNQAVSAVTVSYARKTTVVNVPVTMLMITDVLTLDGILNSRNGHDSTATTWEDLSESGNDFTKASGANNSVWADDHAIYNASDRRLTLDKSLFSGLTNVTIEFVMRFTGNGSYAYSDAYYASFFDTANWDGDHGIRLYAYKKDSTMYAAGSLFDNSESKALGTIDDADGKIVYGVFVITPNQSKAYRNGVLVRTNDEITFPISGHYTAFLGGYKSTKNNFFPHAELYRFGISSHAMTAEEIVERYAFFQDRFNFGGESA